MQATTTLLGSNAVTGLALLALKTQALTLRNWRISRPSSLMPYRMPISVSVETPVITAVSRNADGSAIRDEIDEVKTDIATPEELLSC